MRDARLILRRLSGSLAAALVGVTILAACSNPSASPTATPIATSYDQYEVLFAD